jgi:hypothetical protein
MSSEPKARRYTHNYGVEVLAEAICANRNVFLSGVARHPGERTKAVTLGVIHHVCTGGIVDVNPDAAPISRDKLEPHVDP